MNEVRLLFTYVSGVKDAVVEQVILMTHICDRTQHPSCGTERVLIGKGRSHLQPQLSDTSNGETRHNTENVRMSWLGPKIPGDESS